ncbi:guanylate cyclase activator 2B-like [Pseudophryne corroboree]|uniref:guanylate cyclase activator 2B-like n=1 Tax=Pseudophryne corroboree TaxID=495146 RepID=UPI0030819AFB
MRSCVLLFFLLCLPGSPAIKIQVGKFTYLLESVRKLGDFMSRYEKDEALDAGQMCHDPQLPEEFQPVCEEDDAHSILIELVETASRLDECEICANPACPGCR